MFVAALHRLFVSGSDRDCSSWMEDYDIPGAEGLDLHHFYRAMAWLGEELEEKPDGALAPRCVKDLIEERLFDRRRDLFTDLSAVFMDTTSLSFYGEGGETLGEHGYSKDYRPDLKQMILSLVVDGDGRPICTEMWPGNTADVEGLGQAACDRWRAGVTQTPAAAHARAWPAVAPSRSHALRRAARSVDRHRGAECDVGDRRDPNRHRPGRQGLAVRRRRALERRAARLACRQARDPLRSSSGRRHGGAKLVRPRRPGAARGLALRHDHGSNFMSDAFQKQIRYWGIAPSYAFVGEPQTNGVIERLFRTLKEQIVYGRIFQTVDDVRDAVRAFAARYNAEWLIEKNGHRSPDDARAAWHDHPFRRAA